MSSSYRSAIGFTSGGIAYALSSALGLDRGICIFIFFIFALTAPLILYRLGLRQKYYHLFGHHITREAGDEKHKADRADSEKI
jgi:hypothetical protein